MEIIGRWSTTLVLALVLGFVSAKIIYAEEKSPKVTSEDAYYLIDRYIDSWVAFAEAPAVAMAVVSDQEIVHEYYAGYADPEKKLAPKKSTLFSVCSISKMFTAIGAAKLEEDKKLNLDDPISRHLPDLKVESPAPTSPEMTTRNLLTHSSGLPRETTSDFWFQREGKKFPSYEEMVQFAKSTKLKSVYPVYQDLQYSNFALSLVGEVIKRTSGADFGTYIKANVFTPLQMTRSAFNISENLYKSDQVAKGYSARGRGNKQQRLSYFNTNGMAAAAGLWTNVDDLAKFMQWQFRLLDQKDWNTKEVLTKKTLKDMHRIQWVDNKLDKMWGLGFSVSKKGENIYVGHSGHCPGYLTYAVTIPKKKMGLIVLTNASSGSLSSLKSVIWQALLSVDGDLEKSGKPIKLKTDWKKHIGHYSWFPIGVESIVFPWKENLATIYYPIRGDLNDNIEKLKHMSENTFHVVNKDKTSGLEMKFEVDAKGKTTHFINGGYRTKKLNP